MSRSALPRTAACALRLFLSVSHTSLGAAKHQPLRWDAEGRLSNGARLLHKRLRNLCFELHGVFWKQNHRGGFAQPVAIPP